MTITYGRDLSLPVLQLKSEGLLLTGFCDSDYAGCLDKARSTTGHLYYNIFTLAGGPISWMSCLQSTVSTSSCQAEYQAISETVKETIFLRQLLEDLGHQVSDPTDIFADNQGAIHLSRNPGNHKRTKHIHVRHHFIREIRFLEYRCEGSNLLRTVVQ
jgi:hypothetical protein